MGVPVLTPNAMLAGPVTPTSCSVGVSPAFYNETNNQVLVCVGNQYVPVTGPGGSTLQTPWLSNINGAGFNLLNAGVLFCDSIVTGSAPNNIQMGGTTIDWQTGTLPRMIIIKQDAETGGNAGSNLYIQRFDDTGNLIGNVVEFRRSDGAAFFFGAGIDSGGLSIDRPAGSTSVLQYTSSVVGNTLGTSIRWQVVKSSAAESGGNVGSDYGIFRFSDVGGFLGQPLLITRSTGNVTFENSIINPGMPTVAPAAGSKILWSDPADGNRVKLAV